MSINFTHTNLVTLFNNRDCVALGEIYSMFYEDLHYYSIGLYRGTAIDSCDAIQDVFLSLWLSSTKFDALINIKAYLFIAVRNNFRQFISKNKTADKFKQYQLHEVEMFEIGIIESEVLSNLHHVLGLLPKESAQILQLFFEGWSIDEIADKLGKTKRTIYNKKSEAISTLKNKLPIDKLLLIITLTS